MNEELKNYRRTVKREKKQKLSEKALKAGPIPLPRRLARAVAKTNMKAAGCSNPNRYMHDNWLKFIPHAKRADLTRVNYASR
jgi:hypothetical protein